MKIVGVAACTAGIAHTYMAREKLIKGAKARGHECVVETQGTIGTEHKLTSEQIAEADVVILAVDVKISGEERFKGKTGDPSGDGSSDQKMPSVFIRKSKKKQLENKN